ncbi:MAG: hypothetical protein JSR82_01390 [Verrucomicrobia bacterium]|nr:hypothetical protein [Verrucomicrobiota bacterium]
MSNGSDPWAKFNEKFRPDLPKAAPAPAPPKLPPPPVSQPPAKLPPPPVANPLKPTTTPPKLPPTPPRGAPAILKGGAAAAAVAAVAETPPANRWQRWLSIAGQVAEVVGSALSASGYKPMQPRPGSRTYEPGTKVRSASALPPKVDLRGHLTPVEDQGPLSSCTANAVAASYEYWVKRWTSRDFDVSRLFIYYNARWRNNEQDKDAGSVIQLAMEGLQNFGSCAEATWPYQKALVLKKPNAASYEEGARNLVHDTRQVPMDLTAWKQCLAEGNPIVFGSLLFDSFDQATQRGGVVPMPTPGEVGRTDHGAHAMCAVGYSDSEGVFIVRNSWGTSWGDQGYCYIPYNYLMNEKFNLGDSWIFVPSRDQALPVPNDIWGRDEKPVTNGGQGVDFDPNVFKSIDYKNIELDPKKLLDLVPWNDVVPEPLREYTGFIEKGLFDKLETFRLGDIVGFDETKGGGIAWDDVFGAKNEEASGAEDGASEDEEDGTEAHASDSGAEDEDTGEDGSDEESEAEDQAESDEEDAECAEDELSEEELAAADEELAEDENVEAEDELSEEELAAEEEELPEDAEHDATAEGDEFAEEELSEEDLAAAEEELAEESEDDPTGDDERRHFKN